MYSHLEGDSHVVNTAWAMLALMAVGYHKVRGRGRVCLCLCVDVWLGVGGWVGVQGMCVRGTGGSVNT